MLQKHTKHFKNRLRFAMAAYPSRAHNIPAYAHSPCLKAQGLKDQEGVRIEQNDLLSNPRCLLWGRVLYPDF